MDEAVKQEKGALVISRLKFSLEDIASFLKLLLLFLKRCLCKASKKFRVSFIGCFQLCLSGAILKGLMSAALFSSDLDTIHIQLEEPPDPYPQPNPEPEPEPGPQPGPNPKPEGRTE